jgi:hypothetical protein
MDPLEPRPPWEQRSSERDMEYAWFSRYAELGESRELLKVAKLCGIPVKLIREAAARHDWTTRAAAYDKIVVEVSQAIDVDESEALAMQYAVGIAMMRLGVKAVQLKNPALIRMKDIRELMQQGAEMARRGAGIADLKIEASTQHRIESQFLDLLGDD